MLSLVNLLALAASAFPWLSILQRRRLERMGQGALFSEAARAAIERATHIAIERRHSAVEPAHLALAVLECAEYQAPDVDRDALQRSLARSLDERRATGDGDDAVPLSHPTFRALAEATRRAVADQQAEVGPEHLLLGIMRDRRSAAAKLLVAAGVATHAAPMRT